MMNATQAQSQAQHLDSSDRVFMAIAHAAHEAAPAAERMAAERMAARIARHVAAAADAARFAA